MSKQKWYNFSLDESLRLLQCDSIRGLDSNQISQLRAIYGLNEIKEIAKRSNLSILKDQFTNIMLLMLIAVAVISGVVDYIDLRNHSQSEGAIPFKDTIAILSIVILNGILGYVQESRAEKALEALKQLSSPHVDVIRDGQRQNITAKEVVPGDLMLLESGDSLCADGLLLEGFNLQVKESALTGEAQAVNKSVTPSGLPLDTPLADRLNMVFTGTEIINGRGKVLVTDTAMDTELGKIAAMIQAAMRNPELIAEYQKLGAYFDESLTQSKALAADLDALAQKEREFYVKTGRLKL